MPIFTRYMVDTVRDWLEDQGFLGSDEQPSKFEDDFSWVTQSPTTVRIATKQAMREAGIEDPSMPLLDYYAAKFSGYLPQGYPRAQGQADLPTALYRIYTGMDAQAEDDPNRVGKFLTDVMRVTFNPELGKELGFSPALTGDQATALLGLILDPTSGRQATSDLKTAVLSGSDEDVFNAVMTDIAAIGTTAFSRLDLQSIAVRMGLIYERFLEAKYSGKTIDPSTSFLEYLGEVGASLLGDLFPGIDWAAVGDAWAGVNLDEPVEPEPAAPPAEQEEEEDRQPDRRFEAGHGRPGLQR